MNKSKPTQNMIRFRKHYTLGTHNSEKQNTCIKQLGLQTTANMAITINVKWQRPNMVNNVRNISHNIKKS